MGFLTLKNVFLVEVALEFAPLGTRNGFVITELEPMPVSYTFR